MTGRRRTLDELLSFFRWLLTATLRSAAPLVFAAMGGLLSERSGITNIALEGFMLMGAFAAVAGTWFFNSPMIGLVVAIVVGAVGGLVFAFWTVTLRADQIVAGTAIVLLGLGLTSFLTEQIWGQAGSSPPVERLPTIGLGMNVLLPVAFLLVPLTDWFLFKTKGRLRVLPAARNRKRRKRSASTWQVPLRHGRHLWGAGRGRGAYLDRGSLPVHDKYHRRARLYRPGGGDLRLDAVGDDGRRSYSDSPRRCASMCRRSTCRSHRISSSPCPIS